MYSPSHYSENSDERILETIRRNSFATVITVDGGEPFVSHLPLILDGEKTLIGHCARANPQWRHFATGQTITAIFRGPHAYISPAWYQPEPDNVPTWNYVAVHVKGKATLIEDPAESYATLAKIVRYFESRYETGWSLPTETTAELAALVRGIVSFKIAITDVQAKFKLSQRESAANRASVIEHVAKFGDGGKEVAEYMRGIQNA